MYDTTQLLSPCAKMSSAAFDVDALSEGQTEGFISGYASIFDEVDSQGDRVVRGAFKASLKTWQTRASLPKMLWQHDLAQPIGYWTKIYEDDVGLYVEGRMLLCLTQAREAYALVKTGVIDGLSIGYRVVEALQGRKSSVRLLTQVDLFEISLVTFAANAQSKVLSVKKDHHSLNDRSRTTF